MGHEREYTTKPYEFGDPFNLDIQRTIRNAITRTGGGTPVRLSPPTTSRSSAPSRWCARQHGADARPLPVDADAGLVPAGQAGGHGPARPDLDAVPARLPRRRSASASRGQGAVEPHELPEVSWDYEYGTNMHARLPC